ncbi:helix-turn-helix transcriptional regulator, partial [Enterobacter hormaechei]
MNNIKQPQQPAERVIREAECRQLTGICRTTRYVMEKEGSFPARRKL